MNWAQFKVPVSRMCLADAVVASWSLTQQVVGSNLFTIMKYITLQKNQGKHLGKTPMFQAMADKFLQFTLPK